MKNTTKKIAIAFLASLASLPAFAQEAAQATGNSSSGLLAIGAGLAIGIAAFGGAMAQSKTAASALEGIARNPAAQDKIFTPMIVALALIEALVILAFLIALFIQQKI
jgi:F-type H+-transporting ATPase subunit c